MQNSSLADRQITKTTKLTATTTKELKPVTRKQQREREREVQINISRAESEHRGRGRRTPCRLGGGDGFGYNCRTWMETIKQHGEGGADGCSSGVDMLHSLKTPPGVRVCII